MRLGGDFMIINIKDAFKLIGISIISFCAVFVCTLFLNYNIDIAGLKEQITSEAIMTFYNAQVLSGKVVSGVSGGCLMITAIIMLLFYIKHYIDTHGKELGILKAMGYSKLRIAENFWVFGVCVLVGTGFGFCSSFLLMPTFYQIQNEDNILPGYTVHFHLSLFVYMVILPTIIFAILSVLYAYLKLGTPVMELLKEKSTMKKVNKKRYKNNKEQSFLADLKKNTVRDRASLIFFIAFASFCYSDMIQMSFSMNELSSIFFAIMIIMIGIILASTILFIAITTVVRRSTKTIAMMRIFGYPIKECSKAVLGGYRPIAYIGFGVGTIYQYALIKIMVSVVFKDIVGVPKYSFDVPALIITLVSFIILYEAAMYLYTMQIKRISLKEIMEE